MAEIVERELGVVSLILWVGACACGVGAGVDESGFGRPGLDEGTTDDGSTGTATSSDDPGSATATSGVSTTASSTTSGSATASDEPDSDADEGSAGESSTGESTSEGNTGPAPAVCGNGVVEGDEACDDANAIEADGCSSSCIESGTLLWSRTFGGSFPGGDEGRGIAVHGDRLVVAGWVHSNDENRDAWLGSMTLEGDLDWTVALDGPAGQDDAAFDLTVGGAGRVFVGGSQRTAEAMQSWVAKYDADGSELWSRFYPDAGGIRIRGMSILDDGHAALAGFGQAGGDRDIVIRRIGGAGGLQWSVTVSSPGGDADEPRGLAVGPTGAIYVTGFVTKPDGMRKVWVGRYEADGTESWTRTYNGPEAGDDVGQAVVVDDLDSVYVCGKVSGSGPSEALVRKYNAQGTHVWTQRWPGPGGAGARCESITLDASRSGLLTTGSASGVVGTALYLKKVEASGSSPWTRIHEAPQPGFMGRDLAVSPDGRTFVTGTWPLDPTTRQIWVGAFTP